jgi:Asp-tRNA(Asn)/Glu-tRNA(Gln) amidotransferase C subunit
LRADEGRRRLAREEVEQLAKQTGHVIAVAQKVYDAEYDKLRNDATVTDFVAVLALRRTREKLLAQQKTRRASAANATYELFSA